MLVLLPFLAFVAGIFSLIVLGSTPVADLVRRENAVPWWYHLPLLTTALFLAPVPLAFAWRITFSTVDAFGSLLMVFHLYAAGLCLWLGLALAAVRGLRPGGATQRRVRTSLVAVVVLVLLGLQPVVWSLVHEVYFFSLAWLGLGTFGGVLWVLAMNRRGPYRLSEGRRWSAAYLLASFAQFGLFFAHFVWLGRAADPSDLVWMTPGFWALLLPVVLVLVGGLRVLAGPLPWPPFVAVAISALTLFVPTGLYQLWRPIPAGTPLPVQVDLVGGRGFAKGATRWMECAQIHGQPMEAGCPEWNSQYYAAPPDLPLTELPSTPVHLLVEDGRSSTEGGWGWGTRITVRRDGEGYRIDKGHPYDSPRSEQHRFATAAELHAWLTDPRQTEGVLEVGRDPAWTAQDFVSLCASWRWQCALVR